MEGLEPPYLAVPDPKSGASTNSATPAKKFPQSYLKFPEFLNIVSFPYKKVFMNTLYIFRMTIHFNLLQTEYFYSYFIKMSKFPD